MADEEKIASAPTPSKFKGAKPPKLLPELDEKGNKRSFYDRLTPRCRRFVDKYLECGEDGTKTVRELKMPTSRPHVRAYKILHTYPGIKEAIEERRGHYLDQIGVNTTRILQEVARIAFFDKRRMFDADGNLLPVHLWPDDVAAVIAGMDIETLYEGSGKDRVQVGDILKFKHWPKVDALKLLMQHRKMLTEKHEITGAGGGPIMTKSADELTDDELAALASAGSPAPPK